MSSRIIAWRRATVLALGLLLFAFGGCGGKSNLRLLYGDVQTLDRICLASSTTLKNASTEIRVLGDGAVVKQRDEAEKGDGDGTLWLPIVLVRELPEYYEAKGNYGGKTPNSKPINLTGDCGALRRLRGHSLRGTVPIDLANRRMDLRRARIQATIWPSCWYKTPIQ